MGIPAREKLEILISIRLRQDYGGQESETNSNFQNQKGQNKIATWLPSCAPWGYGGRVAPCNDTVCAFSARGLQGWGGSAQKKQGQG
jgi:hypothetical protein